MAMHGARRRGWRFAIAGVVGVSAVGLVSCQSSWPWKGDGSGDSTTGAVPVTTGPRGVLNDRLPLNEKGPTLRARIVENARTVDLGGPRFVILSVPGRSEAPLTVRTPVTVTAEARQWVITPSGAGRSVLQRRLSPGFDYLNIEAVGGGEISVNNQRHPGTIRLMGLDGLAGSATRSEGTGGAGGAGGGCV